MGDRIVTAGSLLVSIGVATGGLVVGVWVILRWTGVI